MSDDAASQLWAAVAGYLADPLQPPATESVRAFAPPLETLLQAEWNASTDGIVISLIERVHNVVTVNAGVHMVESTTGEPGGYSMRPLEAEFSTIAGARIRVGARSEAQSSTDPWRFLRKNKQVRHWEPSISVSPPDAKLR